jgi:flagellar biosynthesis protein FlhB
MLEAKTLLTAMAYILGIPLTFLGILENYGTWRANVLFFLIAAMLLVRIVFMCINRWQIMKKHKMELERQRFELDKLKSDTEK